MKTKNSHLIRKGLTKVILFGSYSKNQYHWGSDVDLLFIVKKDSDVKFEDVYDVLLSLSNDFAWSPIVKTQEEIQKLINGKYFWILDALKSRKIIFGL